MSATALQARIDAFFRSEPGESRDGFSSYIDAADDVLDALEHTADQRGIDEALDLLERMPGSRARRRHGLSRFVVGNPTAVGLGLRVPSIAETAPHITWPSKRGSD